ncbi:MAG: carbohydrate deacetylase [Acidimicrobiia bacterium]
MVEHPGGERLLIVNADDYGLTEGVSRGILDAAANGIVTSTSVLAVAPAFERSAPWLAGSGLAVGAHLAAVGEDPPLLSAREVPTLVDRRGAFARSWRQLLPRVAAGRVDPADLRREFAAQIERIAGAGLAVGHVDSHQHVHLWPAVGRVVLDVAGQAGVRAVRIIRSASGAPVGRVVNRLGRRFEAAAAGAGFAWPATATGLDEAGALAGPRMLDALGRLGASGAPSAELAVHPGEHRDLARERYRWGYRWGDELDALRDPATRAAVGRWGFRLGTYAELGTA